MKTLLKLFALAAFLASATIVAQNVVSSAPGSFVRSSLTAASGTVTTESPDLTTEIMIRNRARVFGDRITASGERYWSVVDADLNGKTGDQLLQRLSPAAIQAGDIRQMNILVNLKRNLTIFTTSDRPVEIGTATLDGKGVNSIAVTSIISASGLAIVTK